MKKLLLLPGLGDVHWVFLKLQDWLAKQGPDWSMPEVSIWNLDARPRTLDYLDLVPWVRKGSYVHIPLKGIPKAIFDGLYQHENAKDSHGPFEGFDALIGTNGNMRNGVVFPNILEGASIDYNYGPVLPEETDPVVLEQEKRGPYFVLCFSGYGMFATKWITRLKANKLRGLLARIKRAFPEHRLLFTGCDWDAEFTSHVVAEGDEVLVGETSLLQLFQLLRASSGFLGWCGGNAILAQHLGVPTVTWWSRDYFPKHDRTGWETPHAVKKHLVLEVEDYHPDRTGDFIVRFLQESNSRA